MPAHPLHYLALVSTICCSGCVLADEAEDRCDLRVRREVKRAVTDMSAYQLAKCEAAIREVAASCTQLPCECSPVVPDCDCDCVPCKWSDAENGKLKLRRVCDNLITEAYRNWHKRDCPPCDPMPCHCQ